MNDDQRKRIAALPDDAPATAVIAAWTGRDLELRTIPVYGPMMHGSWEEETWLVPDPNDPKAFIETIPSNTDLPHDERTLRRWLLDGDINPSFEKKGNGYLCELNGMFSSIADSPEAAFAAAVAQFASALREDAK